MIFKNLPHTDLTACGCQVNYFFVTLRFALLMIRLVALAARLRAAEKILLVALRMRLAAVDITLRAAFVDTRPLLAFFVAIVFNFKRVKFNQFP